MKKKTRTTTATRKKTTYPRKKGFGLGGFFKMPDVKQDLPKAAAVVGGVIIARFVGGQLDKFILSKSVGDIA